MRRTSILFLLVLVASMMGLAAPASAATTLWVNDNAPVGTAPGTSCTDPGYNTVQAAVDAAVPGDTIRVCGGTYAENVSINTPNLTIRTIDGLATIAPASGNGVTLLDDADGLEVHNLRLDATGGIGLYTDSAVDDVSLRGLRVNNSPGNGINIHNNAVINDWDLSLMRVSGNRAGMRIRGEAYGMTIRDDSRFTGNEFGLWALETTVGDPIVIDDLTVVDSQFNDNSEKGLYFEALSNSVFERIEVADNGFNTGYNAAAGLDINLKADDFENIAIQNSLFNGNGHGSATFGGGLTIKARDDAPSYNTNPATLDGVTVSNNVVTDNAPVGIRFGESGKTNAGPTSVVVFDNSLAGNAGPAVENVSASLTDASANWWGTNDAAGVPAQIAGDVDYTPWLDTGVDTDAAAGFQGDFSTLHVDDDSPQTGPANRIQEGVNLVDGSDVLVKNGNYAGDVTIDKPNLRLLGQGSTTTIIDSGTRGIILGPNADGGRLSGLKIDGMTQEGVYTNSAVDDYTIRNFRSMNNGTYGIGIHNDAVINDWDISQTVLTGNSTGMRVRGEAYDLTIRDGTRLNDNVNGLYSISSAGDPAVLDGLMVSDTMFNDNSARGMYLEALDNAWFENIEVLRTGGTGVDINLKYGDHENITFVDSLFADTTGTGLFVKGRNDGANGGSLDGFLATGITSRDNSGSGVTFGNLVTNAEVTQSNLHDNDGAGLFDYTDAGTGMILAQCNWWGATDGPSGQGPGSGDEVHSVNDGVVFTPWLTAPAPGPCDGPFPMDHKENVRDELAAMLPTGDDKDDKEIEKAIEAIDKSLDPSLWVDEDTLNAKHGHKVFDEEKKAVKHLEKVETVDVSEQIDALVEIDRRLAVEAIEDANDEIAEGGDPKEIEKAEKERDKALEELDKGDDERANGDNDKAIDKYKKAWEKAQKAIEHANK